MQQTAIFTVVVKKQKQKKENCDIFPFFGLKDRLFDLLLYVQGKQLRSCQDRQLSLPYCSWTSLPEEVYKYLVYILSLFESAEEEEWS